MAELSKYELVQRGWTDAVIASVLGRHDRVAKSGTPMFERARVLRAEADVPEVGRVRALRAFERRFKEVAKGLDLRVVGEPALGPVAIEFHHTSVHYHFKCRLVARHEITCGEGLSLARGCAEESFYPPLIDWLLEQGVGDERFRAAVAVAAGGDPAPLEEDARRVRAQEDAQEAERSRRDAEWKARLVAEQAERRARLAAERNAAILADEPAEIRTEFVSLAGLRLRGWTDKMVGQYLGVPDRLGVNQHYRTGPPVRLYARDRVADVEHDPGFRRAMAVRREKWLSRTRRLAASA